MDPMGRKKLENCLKIHKRIDRNLIALNITHLKMSCDSVLFKNHPASCSLIKELEEDTKYLKNFIDKYDLADRYKEPYAYISSYSKTIQDLSVHSVWHSEKKFKSCKRKLLNSENSKHKLNRLQVLVRHLTKKINFLIKENPLSFYIRNAVKEWHNNTRRMSCKDNNLLEIELRKFIKVINLMPPVLELLPNDKRGWKQFLFLVKLLNTCCDEDINDSDTILKIISILVKIKVKENGRFIFIQQPVHSPEFFGYILQHVQSTGKHDILFMQEHSRNAWKYCSNFSIIDAVTCGDEKRLKMLIYYGFNAFPKDERLNKVDEFPDLSQVIPLEHRLILEMMKNIQQYNLRITDSTIILTEAQKKCVLIVLQESTDSFVTKIEMNESLRIEYNYSMFHNLSEHKCMEKFLENEKLVNMYAINFSKFAETTKSNDIFKHFLYLPYGNIKGKVIFRM
ncbi:uncharacterized protein [Parasteatoda tepidariorum]|uniref:uncharacterized protein n=1 Tax=Parasteatoda tepidariorum TaxID=114398 RepID=UPI00077F94A9|nr:uncharacterized protein LOC107457099 [Parasteatoda tepidariorum]XP_015930650.1 uncharacterized protein LOC107457099 [Parasteatoda tepidariorum]